MITSMYKRQYGKTIYVYGDLNKQDVAELKNEGYKIEQRDKPKGKHGIQQEGARTWRNAKDADVRSRHRKVSNSDTAPSAKRNTKQQKRSS